MLNRTIYLLYTLLLCPIHASATNLAHHSVIQVDIISADGRIYPVYDVDMRGKANVRRAWLEVVNGQNYAVRIYNNSNRRLGLVIAIDGRNIISGKKSNLAYTERMYILDPWQSARYDGWRTSNHKVNQFFFTDAENSYADAWQDHSAMGVIAIAAFKEKKQYRSHIKKSMPFEYESRNTPSASSVDKTEASDVYNEKSKQAGTGFGEEKYSYVKTVSFKPWTVALEKVFYKYEWRETLCQQRVVVCNPVIPNRFWPEPEEYYGYAPYPPG